MKKLLTIFLLLLTGCLSPIKRSHIGFGHTGPIIGNVLPDGEYASGISGGAAIGPTFEIYENIKLDLLLGPSVFNSLHDINNKGTILSFDIAPRIRLDYYDWEPYGGVFIGSAYMTRKWPEQGTSWGFVLGIDLGIRKKWGDYYYSIGYRSWHESNGSRVFGHPGQPNPGFNIDMLTLGIEW